MARGTQVGVLHTDPNDDDGDSNRCSEPRVEDAGVNAPAKPMTPRSDAPATTFDLNARRSSAVSSQSRSASRKLSMREELLVRKTSVVLSSPVAATTVFSHAEMKRLELFTAKYMGNESPPLASSRTSSRALLMRPRGASVRSSIDHSSTTYSEVQPTLGLTELDTPATTPSDSAATATAALPAHEQPEWLVTLRQRTKCVVQTRAFRAAVHFIVLSDMAVLALDDDAHATATGGSRNDALAHMDIAFTFFLGFEIVLKSIAFTLYTGPESYLRRSRFRILNIVVLVASLASHVSDRRELRVLRGIKTFRSLTMYAGLRRILRALIRAVPFLANVATLALFFLLAFSIFGLEAFSGAFDHQCSVVADAADVDARASTSLSMSSDSSSSSSSSIAQLFVYEALPRVFCAAGSQCAAFNQTCVATGAPSKHVNFDSGVSSLFLVFLVVAQDGWVTDIMEPVLESRSYWTVMFFVGIIVSMVFLVVNLFVAVITTAFMNFTIDNAAAASDNSDKHPTPRFMGKRDGDDEDTHVSLIMGATLAIEESMQSSTAAIALGQDGSESEADGNDDHVHRSKRASHLSTAASVTSAMSPRASGEHLLNGKAREAIGMLAQRASHWRSMCDATAEAAKELLQTPSLSIEEFMLPFAHAYRRHTSSPKNTTRNSSVDDTMRSSNLDAATVAPVGGGRKPSSLKPTLLVDIHEHAPFESTKALVQATPSGSAASTFTQFQTFVFSKKFDDTITLCIAINMIFLLLEYPNMPNALRIVLNVTEYLFGSLFAVEMVARIVAMRGLRAYLRTTERRFDMIVVVCTTVNMVLNNVDTSFSGLNSVSSLRTLRVSRLMLKWDGTRKLIMSVLKSSRGIMDVVAFLVLFQIVTSILAMQLFGGGSYLTSSDDAAEAPRWHFDTFSRSFLTLLQVITGDQWSNVTYDAVDAAHPHWLLVPFLILIFIVGQYVLLNLFIAVILDNFAISEEEAYQLQLAQIIAIPKELDIFEAIEEHGVRAFGEMDQLENVSNVKLRMFLGLDDAAAARHAGSTQFSTRVGTSSGNGHNSSGGGSNGRVLRTHAAAARAAGTTCVATMQRQWHRLCMRIACNAWFSRFIQLVVMVSCFNLILDDPHPHMSRSPPSEWLLHAVELVNNASLVAFVVEFIVKVGAFGFGWDYVRIALFRQDEALGYVKKQAYMEDRWNQLDVVLLVIAAIDAVLTSLYPAMSAAGVFRAGRVLRPLRILNHNHDMKAILTAVAQSVPQVGNVFALCMIVYIIFGVVGRSLFAGKFYACNDATVATAAECVGFFLVIPDGALSLQEATERGVTSGAILVPRVWANARFSFDHIGAGFLTLLEMTSLKWIDKTFAAMDIAGSSEGGLNKQPVMDASPENAIFFVLYVYVGSLFVIRLFVGVLVEQFQRNDGTQILTESQKSWVDLEKFILLLQPLKIIPRPRSRILNKLYDVCENPRFAHAVSAAVLLNILLLLINPSGSKASASALASFKAIEIIFLMIFTAEASIKCLAQRHYYLLSANGLFEVGILVGSLAAYFSASGYHSLIQAGRVFRVLRVLRVVKLNRGVYAVFQTFRASLRPISHIFLLMCTLIYIFAIVARQLFGGVKFGPAMNHFSNFRTFGSSVLLLFQIMSGDDWHLTMTDCMASKPFCSERVVNNATGEVVTDCGSVVSAATFFAMYVTIVVFIFLNLFVTVILENFRSCYLKSDVCAISLLDFEAYRAVFRRYDTHGTGSFPLWQLASFLHELPPGLRIDRKRQRRAFLQIRSQVQALLGAADATDGTPLCGPWKKRPYFNELLRVLCIHQMGIRSLPYEQQRDRVKQIFIYRAKVAHMIVESVVKGYVYRWRQRKQQQNADDAAAVHESTARDVAGASGESMPGASESTGIDTSLRRHAGNDYILDPDTTLVDKNDVDGAADDEATTLTRQANDKAVSLGHDDVSASQLVNRNELSPSLPSDDTVSDDLEHVDSPQQQRNHPPDSRKRTKKHHHHRHRHHHRSHIHDTASDEDVRDHVDAQSDSNALPPLLATNSDSQPLAETLTDVTDARSSEDVNTNGSSVIRLVVKTVREPVDDPAAAAASAASATISTSPSASAPRRLPRLNSTHRTSKVVPT